MSSIVLALFVGCGGGGGGGTTGPSGSPAKLFVAADGYVLSFASAQLASGPGQPDRRFSTEGLYLASDVAYDAERDELYVANGIVSSGFIAVFEHPGTTSGESAVPKRMIWTTGAPYRAISLDAANDVLYAAAGGSIQVFEHASSLAGTVTPSRSLPLGGAIDDLVIDSTRAILYALFDGQSVVAYATADLVDGTSPRFRLVMSGDFTRGLALDPGRDMLYVGYMDQISNAPTQGVAVIPHASTATNVAHPTILWVASPQRMDVDPVHDRLYASGARLITMIEHVSTATPGLMTATEAEIVSANGIEGVAFVP